jgi:hypothetical protein
MAEGAQDGKQGPGGALRWLVLTAVVLAAIFGGRRWALRRADAEFERRLMEADRSRN